MSSKTVRTVTYRLYDIVIKGNKDGKTGYEIITDWFTPIEFAALKRSKKWKERVSCKLIGSITITLKL